MRIHKRFLAMGSVVVAVLVVGLAGPVQADWVDDFDQPTFDARWGLDMPNVSLGDITLDTVNDWAHFEAYGNTDMWTVRNNAPILWTPSSVGDSYIETHVMSPTTQNGSVAGLTVYADADASQPNFTFGLDHWNNANRMVKLQGLGTNNPNIFVPALGGEAWLRLELSRDGGAGGVDQYTAMYKLNAADPWSTLATLDRDVSNARMGLFLKTSGAGRTADFTYAAGSDPAPPPPPANPIQTGDVIKLDFSNAGDGDGGSLADWNQTTNAVAAIPNGSVIRNGDGAVVGGVAISFSGGGGGFNNDGASGNWPGTAADPYYILAADDIYYGPGALTTTFSGLDPALSYNVRIANLIGNNPGAVETFTVTDGIGLRVASNLRGDRWVAPTLEAGGTVFTGLTASGSGVINVIVQNSTGGGGYYPLNAIVLEAGDPLPLPPPGPPMWSVDIQGAGGPLYNQENPPVLMTGPDPIYGLGNVWNAFDVPGHNLPAATNPSMSLVDSQGNASPVTFTLIGSAAGFSNAPGGHPLFKDYVFDSAGNAGPDYTWEITGVKPGGHYDLILYGGVARAADFQVDVDGDGDLSNNPVGHADPNSAYQFRGIVADGSGRILGNMGVNVAAEQNWSGFQLIEVPEVEGTVWSVDLQGSPSNGFGQSDPALPMTGVEPIYGFGNAWNEFNVPGHNLPVQNDPSMALVDSEGNPTGVTFSISGPTAGWGGNAGTGGRLNLVRDYLFVDAGNVAGDLTADWTISGLDPTHVYEMFAYGGIARDMLMTIDLDGNGALDNDTGRLVNATGLLFGPITPDAAGNIIGSMRNGTGDAEGNWSGFQLRDITSAAVPEPSSLALAALALLGLGLYGQRRRRRS